MEEDELRPAKRNVEVEVEVKAVDRFRYDASKSKGYVRLTATFATAFAAISLARPCAFDASFSSRSFAVDRYCFD